MLFNSIEFIFLFLPITLLVFFFIGKYGYHRLAITWLVIASLFFYGWWNPRYLLLLLASIGLNFFISSTLNQKLNSPLIKKTLLILGIAANLIILAWFKYANFLVTNVGDILGINFNLQNIILPLGISFFTFQQITYLVDSYSGETKAPQFLNYCLFITFFPKLISRPIVHQSENTYDLAYDFSYPSEITIKTDNTYDGSHYYPDVHNQIAHILEGEQSNFGISIHKYSLKEYQQFHKTKLKEFLQKQGEGKRW